MNNKISVLICCGGRSPEHNISLLSANSILSYIDRVKYDVKVVGITKDGIWKYHGDQLQISNPSSANQVALDDAELHTVLLSQNYADRQLIRQDTGETICSIDVVFPVLHGEYGEDGSIQGFLKMCGIPYVGCDIIGSSICMDKDVAKRLLRDADINVANFITIRKGYNETDADYHKIADHLGSTLFLKPANLGSSVGVSCVKSKEAFEAALELGFRYDDKVIIEEKITGREIECAVLGNQNPKASSIGEIVPKTGVYDFESKYVDDDGAELSIPADIDEDTALKAKTLAIKAYKALECKGMSRVDMFLESDGRLVLNEINTIPGFTKISMYPKLWQEDGITYTDLISELIALAIK